MSRLDHVAFESADPSRAAAFYEDVLGARIVRAAGHPVMAYVGTGGFASTSAAGQATTSGCA
ncbi:MAG TPA: VOC family protein [Gaiellaceae bacterium]|nr:VOC family protein [Gaiellaceae bacterium]